MALKFIGIPLFILLIAALIVLLIGILRRNRRLVFGALLGILAVLGVYAILFLVFH